MITSEIWSSKSFRSVTRALVVCIILFALFRILAPTIFQYAISYFQLIVSMANGDKDRAQNAEKISWEMEYRLHEMDMLFYQQKCEKQKEKYESKEPVAWLTAMMNDNYAVGAVLVGHMIQKLSCHKKMIVLVSDGVSEMSRQALKQVGYEVHVVEPLDCNWMDRRKNMKERNLGLPGTHMRFHAWNYTQYKKILYVDGDIIPLVSVDELFDLEGEIAASYCARPGIIDPCFNAGILLFKPSTSHYHGIMDMWTEKSKGKYCPNDQVLLWHYYADNGLWTPFPYAYNVRRYLYHPLKIYHFACCLTKKPWQVKNRPTKQEIDAFNGPITEPEHVIILWWRYFYDALDTYKLHDWYEKVQKLI